MQELEKRIGQLRIMLADISGKQTKLSEMESQYRTQLERIVEFVVYREGDLGNALSLMSEVQAKLDEVTQTSGHLGRVSSKAGMELEVLLLTKRVTEARSQLAKLEERQQELAAKLSSMSGPPIAESLVLDPEVSGIDTLQIEDIRAIYDQVESEMARLHSLITEASDRAARTVQARVKEHA